MYKVTEIEKKYVHEFYNQIAEHWYKTRTRECSYWPVVIDFINSIKPFSIVADIGVGSGRFMNYRDDLIFIGLDCSISLLKICKKQNLEVICNNALNISIRDNAVDATYCIAMLHHLSTEENRLQVIKELIRITKINGQIFLYVWAYNQDNNSRVSDKKFTQKDCLIPWHLQEKYIDKDKLLKDNKISYNTEQKLFIFQRYCHLFIKDELYLLFKKINNIKIIKDGYDRGNIYIQIEKYKE